MAFGPNSTISAQRVRDRVAVAAASGADCVMCFVESDGYSLWPSETVPSSPLRGDVDVVGELVEACQDRGLRFVAMWMGCHCQTLHLREHPTWAQRDALGNTAATMCLNSPFGGSLLNQVREVVSTYRPDGVYFDGIYSRIGGCYCIYCRQRFQAAYGQELPVLVDVTEGGLDVAEREHWIAFSAEPVRGDRQLDSFRISTVDDFLRRVRDVIDRHGESALILDTLGVTAAYYTNGHDLRRMAESVDAFLLESYWERLGEPVIHVALEAELVKAETGRPLWWARWLARHPDGEQVSIPKASVQVWAAQTMVKGARPAAVEQNLFELDARLAGAVEQAMSATAEVTTLLEGTEKLRYAALLHSPRTKEEVHARWRARDYFDALEGTYQALNEAHIPTDLVIDDDVEAATLAARYRVLVIPNAMYLTPESAEVIREFLELGGGVVASYMTGVMADGGPRDVGILDDVFGVSSMGVGERSGRVGPESFGGTEPVSYFRIDKGHQFGDDVAPILGSFQGPYRRVRVDSDHEVAAWILESDYRLMDGKQFFSWYPGRPESAYLVTGRQGSGRTAYFATDPGSSFFRSGSDTAADVLVRAVVWAADADPLVRLIGPPTVDCQAMLDDGEGGMHIVLANRTSHDLFAVGRPSIWHSGPNGSTTRDRFTSAIVPVAGLEVAISEAAGLEGRATSLRGQPIDVRRNGSGLVCSLSRLDDFDVLTVR
jgi:hypothetical protein